MNSNSKISYFENYKAVVPAHECTISDFCLSIINGDHRKEIENLRKVEDKKKRNELKSKLPAVTISGTFKKREGKAIIQHSGYIAIDIDEKENPQLKNWEYIRYKLSKCENVFFSALSASGNGVFLIIPIYSPSNHELHFKALEHDFQKELNIKIDNHCIDVTRLRGTSYDPEATINLNAKPYKRIPKMQKPDKIKIDYNSLNNRDQLNIIIKEIISKGIDITGDYAEWFGVGRAIVNEYGEAGRAIFHNLSRFSNKYCYNECERQYNACLKSPGKATKNTIFYHAKNNNVLIK